MSGPEITLKQAAAALGRIGGAAGRGTAKARSHEQAVRAGQAGAAKRWAGHVKKVRGLSKHQKNSN